MSYHFYAKEFIDNVYRLRVTVPDKTFPRYLL